MATRTFDELLARYPPEVRALAQAARKFILALLPKAEETVDTLAPVIGYGYGPGYKGMICTLILSKAGVKVGLARGTELPDPEGLLEGSGKVHLYIALEKPADLRKPGVKKLVRATAAAWRERTESSMSPRRSLRKEY